jgi:3-carboxy-cis,cis-muconate cycloisomerase
LASFRVFDQLLSDPEVDAVLRDAALTAAMVEVERALARVQGQLGVVPAEAAAGIDSALAGFVPDLDALAAGVCADGVPVPALVRMLRAVVGAHGDFLHRGATSQDIVDTALVLQLRSVLDVLEARLGAAVSKLAGMADVHRATPMLARTRWQQAVATSFGLKVAGWLAPLLRHRERLAELRPRLLVVQLGGAGGNLAVLGEDGPAVVRELARELGLGAPVMPWHAQRDNLIELGGWLAGVAGSLGKLGQDVLLMAQSEVGELRETGGGGSSSMPQKSNPVRAEALVALGRAQAGSLATLHQAMLHAHERDGAAWQLEWQALPRLASGTGAALLRCSDLLDRLDVDSASMAANLAAARGLPLAEAATAALARQMPRHAAQALVRRALAQTEPGRNLIDVLAETTAAPVDWTDLRDPVRQLGPAVALIDAVLAEV